jgi:hypothetical protein
MPICRRCQTSFPNRIEVEGRRRNISNRKYCLSCSPWGLHNTRPIPLVEQQTDAQELTCTICSKSYEFNRKRGHTLTKCNSCSSNQRRFELKEKCVKYKGGMCQMCGYDKCMRALTFHHRDDSTKKFGISGVHCLKWETIRIELDKCDLLCANCHAERHDQILRTRGTAPTTVL